MQPIETQSSPGLGLFIDRIDTKKGGPFSPVKRSFRINPKHQPDAKPHQLSTDHQKPSMEGGNIKAVRFLSPEKGDTNNMVRTVQRGTPAAVKTKEATDDIDHLCTLFQSTVKVDDTTLKVQVSNIERTSPMPKDGRYTVMVPKSVASGKEEDFIAVKRSLRSRS